MGIRIKASQRREEEEEEEEEEEKEKGGGWRGHRPLFASLRRTFSSSEILMSPSGGEGEPFALGIETAGDISKASGIG